MASRRDRVASYLGTVMGKPTTLKWLLEMRFVHSYARLLERLRAGDDVNSCEADGVRALHLAARHGAMELLKHLLEDGAGTTLRSGSGWTALHFAHIFLQNEAVNYLTVHHAIVEKLTDELQQPPTAHELYVAMNFDDFRVFRANIKKHVEVQGAQFVKAARRDDLELVRAMLETKQVHVDTVLPLTGETAYSAALSSGRQEMCEYLLACGAHTYATCIVDDEPRSPLATAVKAGDVSFVKRLVLAGASCQTPPHDANTCGLLQAIKMGSIPMVNALLDLGVRMHSYQLAERLSIPAFVGVDKHSIQSSDARSWLALCCACWFQDDRLVEHLLDTRSVFQDPKELSINGVNALLLAVYRENYVATTMLLERGISVNKGRLRDGKSALEIAVSTDSVDMLRFLIDRGADTEAFRDPDALWEDVSLLLFAVRRCAINCARELLPTETREDQRDLVLAEAVQLRDQEFLEFILDHSPPSTFEALITCIEETSCPEMLDLLLTHANVKNHLLLELDPEFQWLCERNLSADRVSVILSHGFTIKCRARTSCGMSGRKERSYGTVTDIFTEETNLEF